MYFISTPMFVGNQFGMNTSSNFVSLTMSQNDLRKSEWTNQSLWRAPVADSEILDTTGRVQMGEARELQQQQQQRDAKYRLKNQPLRRPLGVSTSRGQRSPAGELKQRQRDARRWQERLLRNEAQQQGAADDSVDKTAARCLSHPISTSQCSEVSVGESNGENQPLAVSSQHTEGGTDVDKACEALRAARRDAQREARRLFRLEERWSMKIDRERSAQNSASRGLSLQDSSKDSSSASSDVFASSGDVEPEMMIKSALVERPQVSQGTLPTSEVAVQTTKSDVPTCETQMQDMRQQLNLLQSTVDHIVGQLGTLLTRLAPPGLDHPDDPTAERRHWTVDGDGASCACVELVELESSSSDRANRPEKACAELQQSQVVNESVEGNIFAGEVALIDWVDLSSCEATCAANQEALVISSDCTNSYSKPSLQHIIADQLQEKRMRELEDSQRRELQMNRSKELCQLQEDLDQKRVAQLSLACKWPTSSNTQEIWDRLRLAQAQTHTVEEANRHLNDKLHVFMQDVGRKGEILDANAMQIYLRHCCVKSASFEAEVPCFEAATTALDMMLRDQMRFTVKTVTQILLQISLRAEWKKVRCFARELCDKTLTHLSKRQRAFLCDHALFALAERKTAFDDSMAKLPDECCPEMRFRIEWEKSTGQDLFLECIENNKDRDELARRGFVALLSLADACETYNRQEQGAIVRVKLSDKGFVGSLLTQVKTSFYGSDADYRLDILQIGDLQAERIMTALQTLGEDKDCKQLQPHKELKRALVTPRFEEYSISIVLKMKGKGKHQYGEIVDGGEFGRLDNFVDPIQIRKLGSGPLSEHPAGVAVGDYVVEVNGERDREAMIVEIQRAQTFSGHQLDITLARPITLEDPDFALPADECARLDDLPSLNSSQTAAIEHCLTNRLSLIQGPPGTGKTTTAVELLDVLIARKKQGSPILATAQTNAAVDNLVRGLARKNKKVVRTGDPSKVAEDCQPYLWDGIQDLQDADVICTTCIGSGSGEFCRKKRGGGLQFHTVLIDECSQATESLSIIPICHAAQRVILVGDQCQLEPFRSEVSKNFELGTSLFNRLCSQGVVPIMLSQQYRMHPGIAEFPAAAFYAGKLGNGISAKDRPLNKCWKWPSKDMPVCFVDAARGEESESDVEKKNLHEVRLVIDCLTRLLSGGKVLPNSIGVMTPYAAQKTALEEEFSQFEQFHGVEVNTVDAFQGREKEIIVFSAVRANKKKSIGFLGDWRRMNVMLTRARGGLIVIGHRRTLEADLYWQHWLQWAASNGCIMRASEGRLPDHYLNSTGEFVIRCLATSWMRSSPLKSPDHEQPPLVESVEREVYAAEAKQEKIFFVEKREKQRTGMTLYDVKVGGRREKEEQEVKYKTKESEQYAKVTALLGGKRCSVELFDGSAFDKATEVSCKVPYKIKKLRPGDILLVDIVYDKKAAGGKKSAGKKSGEIVFKYEPEQGLVERLLRRSAGDGEVSNVPANNDVVEIGSYGDMLDLPEDFDESDSAFEGDSVSSDASPIAQERSEQRLPAMTTEDSLPLYMEDVTYDGDYMIGWTVVVQYDRTENDGIIGSLPEWGSNFEAYLPVNKSAKDQKSQAAFLQALRKKQVTSFAADVVDCELRHGRFYLTLNRDSIREVVEQDAKQRLREVEAAAALVDKAARLASADVLQARRAILYKSFENAGGHEKSFDKGAMSGPEDPRMAAVDLLRRCGNLSEHEARAKIFDYASSDLPAEFSTSLLDLCAERRRVCLVTCECLLRFNSSRLFDVTASRINQSGWEVNKKHHKKTYTIVRPCHLTSCVAMRMAEEKIGDSICGCEVAMIVAGPGVCKLTIQCADDELEDVQENLDEAVQNFMDSLEVATDNECKSLLSPVVNNASGVQAMQPTVTVGLIGDVAHGKTTTIKMLTNKSTQQHSSEKQAHGKTIRLGYANCLVCHCPRCAEPDCYFTVACSNNASVQSVCCPHCDSVEAKVVKCVSFVDCPGHAELMGTMMSGSTTFDAVLFVAAADAPCPTQQAKAHIEALRSTTCVSPGNFAVIQSKADLVISRHKDAPEDATEILQKHHAAAAFALRGIAEDVPVFPVAAPQGLGLNAVAMWLASLPDSSRTESSTDSRMTILRQFDTNKPGAKVSQTRGLVFGGSLACGEIQVEDDIEIRPGRFERCATGSFTVQAVRTKVEAIQSGDGNGTIALEKARAGGLVALQTPVCPSFHEDPCFDCSVVGAPGTLPPVWEELELDYALIADAADLCSATEEQVQLRVHAGSASAEAAVAHVGEQKLRLQLLDKPLCALRASNLAIERKDGRSWVLCAHGKLVGGKQCLLGKDAESPSTASVFSSADAVESLLPKAFLVWAAFSRCHQDAKHFVESFLLKVNVSTCWQASVSEDSFELHREGKASYLWKNFASVMESLGRKPDFFVGFLKSECGLDSGLAGEDRRMLRVQYRGHELKTRLQSLLAKFIDTYVTCRQCGTHDTDLQHGKLECRSCKAQRFADFCVPQLNIPDSEDPSCRYKMPALQIQVRGSGKMIRTVILNIKDVAEALCCSAPRRGTEGIPLVSTPECVLRFLSLSLGTDGDPCTNSIGGSWSASKLQETLRHYIDDFVSCPGCHLPEMQLHFNNDGTIGGRCLACAWQGALDLTRSQSQRLAQQMFKRS